MPKQPWRGIWGTLVCWILSICLITLIDPSFLVSYVAPILIATAPWTITFLFTWPATEMAQPLNGLTRTTISFIGAWIIILLMSNFTVGFPRGLFPWVLAFSICSIGVCLHLVSIFDSWPFKGRVNPPWLGFTCIVVIYGIMLILYKLLVNYNQPPFNIPEGNPGGLYNWLETVAIFTMLIVFQVIASLFDFWPFTKLKQPWRGVVLSAALIPASLIAWNICLWFFGEYAVEKTLGLVEAPMLLGMLTLSTLFGGWPANKLRQPLKGAVLLILSIVIGAIGYLILSALGCWWYPAWAEDPTALYTLWIYVTASILDVILPFMMIYALWDLYPATS